MRSEANRGQATLETFAETLRREAALPGHALLALLYTGKELLDAAAGAEAAGRQLGATPRLPPPWRVALEARSRPAAAASPACVRQRSIRSCCGSSCAARPRWHVRRRATEGVAYAGGSWVSTPLHSVVLEVGMSVLR